MASAVLRNNLLGPISVAQFHEHFHRARAVAHGRELQNARFPVPTAKHDFLETPRRFGLAVSGGADSMALAYLCRQLEVQDAAAGGTISFTAFVVDHHAREESSREARTVVGWLSDMGLKTQLLELDWSHLAARLDQKRPSLTAKESPSASMPTAFETYARQLRYHALGVACRENGIGTLLMGHHQDDNVETTIWRLCSGARGAGLTGIPQLARMPECHGLFGVAESGSKIEVQESRSPQRIRTRINKGVAGSVSFVPEIKISFTPKTRAITPGISIASGGMFVYRPLLSFPKASVAATCDANNIPYVSDPTNFDPTLTPRNAIRSLREANAFPRALQSPSILSLVRSNQNLLQNILEVSNCLLESQCRILDFNFRAGSMAVQVLPLSTAKDSSSSDDNTHLLNKLSTSQMQQTQAIALRRLTELVSPTPANQHALRTFSQYISAFFPDPNNSDDDTNGTYDTRRPFTVGGVMFHPLTSTPFKPATSSASTPKSSPVAATRTPGNNIWLLSRQPLKRSHVPVMRADVPVSDPILDASSSQSQPSQSSSSSSSSPSISDSFTPWRLWDDRYWFRLRAERSITHPSSYTSSKKTKDNEKEKEKEKKNYKEKEEEEEEQPPPSPPQTHLKAVIRAFQNSDFEAISSGASISLRVTKDGRERTDAPLVLSRLRKSLSEQASGSVRFTVPVLTVEGCVSIGSASETASALETVPEKQEHLLALPTLPIRLTSGRLGKNYSVDFYLDGEAWTMHWEWMYKRIDIEVLRLMGWQVETESGGEEKAA